MTMAIVFGLDGAIRPLLEPWIEAGYQGEERAEIADRLVAVEYLG